MITQNTLIDREIEWIKNNSSIHKFPEKKEVLELTTPFLDRHNDYIQLYIISKNNNLIITDDGFTYADLVMSGIAVNNIKTKQILEKISQNYNVVIGQDKELYINTTSNTLIESKHKLIQAIVLINNLFNYPSMITA